MHAHSRTLFRHVSCDIGCMRCPQGGNRVEAAALPTGRVEVEVGDEEHAEKIWLEPRVEFGQGLEHLEVPLLSLAKRVAHPFHQECLKQPTMISPYLKRNLRPRVRTGTNKRTTTKTFNSSTHDKTQFDIVLPSTQRPPQNTAHTMQRTRSPQDTPSTTRYNTTHNRKTHRACHTTARCRQLRDVSYNASYNTPSVTPYIIPYITSCSTSSITTAITFYISHYILHNF